MNVTLGLLAHVDAGKTTFAERLLYHSGSIRKAGRVDHRDTFLDSHEIERARGITVFSQEACFELGEKTFFLLDTPGHTDFVSETERGVKVMDYAVLIISCVEGIQSHTETLWKLLDKHKIPVFVFLNKSDRNGAEPERVLNHIKRKFSENAVLFDSCENIVENKSLLEELAQRDEVLLENYFSDSCTDELVLKRTAQMIKERKVFPCFVGSALQDVGIDCFIKALETFALGNNKENEDFSASVYKVRYDGKGTRMTYLKIRSGSIKVKEEIIPGVKINEMYICHGEKLIPASKAVCGGLYAVTGPSELVCGDEIEKGRVTKSPYEFYPMLSAGLEFDRSKCSDKTMMGYLNILQAEEPMLMALREESTRQITVRVMGEIQLEVLKFVLKQRFNIDVDFGECKILYLETIKNPVVGRGHFEPLRHYAEVHLRLVPTERGSGISFSSQCSLEVLEKSFQNLVRTHVFEKVHKGVLTGSPITDIEFVLLTGRTHLKHTEGGDFREAVYRAIRQGLRKAESVLLEPWYSFEIEADSGFTGRIMSDIQRMYGSFLPPETEGNNVIIKGEAPVESFRSYPKELMSFTSGRAVISLRFCGYKECHNTEEVVGKIGYNADRDTENTADSVFCSHGAGYAVKWNEADSHMHCVSSD